jgi:hypothetical protein
MLLPARAISTANRHEQRRWHADSAATAAAAALVAAGAAVAAVTTGSFLQPPAHSQEQQQAEHHQKEGRLPLEFVEGLKAIVGEDNVTTDPDE